MTSEPYWKNEVVGVWRDREEEDGLAHFVRVSWYRDLQHWIDSRQIFEEPISANLWVIRATLEVDDDRWSAGLLER